MSVKSLSNISSIATEETNTTGVLDPILSIDPEDGTVLALLNRVARGTSEGLPIYANLEDSNGDDLPEDTRMALAFETPQMDSWEVVSEPMEHIRAYRALTIQEQQNTDFVDRVKHVLKGGASALVAEDVDTIYVVVDASSQIDWSNSSLTFEEKAVRER